MTGCTYTEAPPYHWFIDICLFFSAAVIVPRKSLSKAFREFESWLPKKQDYSRTAAQRICSVALLEVGPGLLNTLRVSSQSCTGRTGFFFERETLRWRLHLEKRYRSNASRSRPSSLDKVLHWVAAVLTTALLMCIRTSVEDDCRMQDMESCPRWWCGGGASISILDGFPPPGMFRNGFMVSQLCDPWQRSAAWCSIMPRCPIVLMRLYCNVVSTAAVNFCPSPLTSSQGCRPLGCFCVF